MFNKMLYLFDNMNNFEVKKNHIAFSRSHRSSNGHFTYCRMEFESVFLAQLDH